MPKQWIMGICQGVFAGIMASMCELGLFIYISILLISSMLYSFALSYLEWDQTDQEE